MSSHVPFAFITCHSERKPALSAAEWFEESLLSDVRMWNPRRGESVERRTPHEGPFKRDFSTEFTLAARTNEAEWARNDENRTIAESGTVLSGLLAV